MSNTKPPIKNLILDAAPLLTLFPLRGLASKYIIAPQVLAEIRDKRAREHFETLGLLEGVEVQVRDVDLVSLAKVTAFAKQTGDYAVLSHTDLCVLALTYAVEVEENGHWRVRDELGKPPAGRPAATPAPSEPTPAASSSSSSPAPVSEPAPRPSPNSSILPSTSSWGKRPASSATPSPAAPLPSSSEQTQAQQVDTEEQVESISQRLDRATLDQLPSPPTPLLSVLPSSSSTDETAPLPITETTALPTPSHSIDPQPEPAELSDDDHSEDDEAEGGAWITPTNVSTQKAKDLGLALPESTDGNKKKKPSAILKSACMTSDFAVQNVLLQMGLNLVGGEGRRIRSVKSWVLRCHACFKLCKDPSKKFCPSCGGPTLIRTSITTSAPTDSSQTEPTTQIHLKKNFQYHNRGTRYSIPAPKAGSAKGQKAGGSGLVLREDQAEWQKGVRMEQGRKAKADRAIQRSLDAGGNGAAGGSWMDADWMPEMYAVGMSGKGRRSERGGGKEGGFLPRIGHGKKNPNAVKRK